MRVVTYWFGLDGAGEDYRCRVPDRIPYPSGDPAPGHRAAERIRALFLDSASWWAWLPKCSGKLELIRWLTAESEGR